jgi:phospholipid/cholesterol/gamma-HCH transport system permease protein
LGKGTLNALDRMLYAAGYFWQVLVGIRDFFRKRKDGYRVLVMQILFTGVEALTIISILALALGAIIIIQGSTLLRSFGQNQLMYSILIVVITRELGPVLTAFVIIARSGTAIATELSTMVINHEIQAYTAFGINPITYLVVPRFIGVMVATFVLSIYFSLFGLLGSWFPASLVTPLRFTDYVQGLLGALQVQDIVISLVKSLVFGAIVAMISSFQGFSVNRSTTEIPVAGIRAVSASVVWVIVSDAIITLLSYLK